jgi:hypothetical protein
VCSGRLGVIYGSQATNSSVEVRGGGSHKESSLLTIGHLGVIYDPQPHGTLKILAQSEHLLVLVIKGLKKNIYGNILPLV